MKNTILYTICLISIVFWSSCRKDFDTSPSTGNLHFSKDTVYLDTIFSNIGSSTYNLKVYNRSSEDINIPSIKLGKGQQSNYRLNVDGIAGKEFTNVELLAKDSLYIFIETTVDIKAETQQNNFLYTDHIAFDQGALEQKVSLVTLVKDAVFLYPEKDENGTKEQLQFGTDEEGNPIYQEGFFLEDTELHFTNQKPYVIYGYAAVPPGKTLQLDAGARVHFHNQSGLIVSNTASLHVNGMPSQDQKLLENEVIFESDRLEPDFSELSGQWETIWLSQGSTNNKINYATIKNATVGILVDATDGSNNPTLEINNTQIYNSSSIGLWAKNSHITSNNLVVGNSGQISLNLSFGGNYTFNNATITNYASNRPSSSYALAIQNILETPDIIYQAPLTQATFNNCIIYGNKNYEFILNQTDEIDFNFQFNNCLLRFNDYRNLYTNKALYNFEDETFYNTILRNDDPLFIAPQENNYNIPHESPANGFANPTSATPTDVTGKPRSNQPDAGAYESTNLPEEE